MLCWDSLKKTRKKALISCVSIGGSLDSDKIAETVINRWWRIKVFFSKIFCLVQLHAGAVVQTNLTNGCVPVGEANDVQYFFFHETEQDSQEQKSREDW